MERKCGIKGCIEYVLPGAFIEVLASVGPGFEHVRVEVCPSHYDVLTDNTRRITCEAGLEQ